MIEGVRLSVARCQLSVVGAREQSSNAASTLESAAQVQPARVRGGGKIVPVPLLQHQAPVIDVARLRSRKPGAGPDRLLANPPPEQPIISKLGFP